MKSVLQSTLLAACKKPRTRHVLLSASEHASANIELASRRKRTIWILAISACSMSSLLGISKLLKQNHGHRFCIAIRSDVSGLDGAAEHA